MALIPRVVRVCCVDTPERGQDKLVKKQSLDRECVEHFTFRRTRVMCSVGICKCVVRGRQRSLNDGLRDAGLLKENSKWNEDKEWRKSIGKI